MSRSGYDEGCDGWELVRWRGAVASAIKGSRGQALLRELAAAMDAMPEKVLIADELQDSEGDYCALGVVGAHRKLDLKAIDPHDPEGVAATFNIAPALAREIVFENDEGGYQETPAERWKRIRAWVGRQITTPGAPGREG